ncbi:carboxypeptidase-like regulatory domain-containing protein [uncultured Mucilaginibacter sp.]|uniref:carboxypeptidase-like regulatory domain-containing protein n=1 Tax=uncultured Mucilaginibacter sp. TaxID=797541 RepID=UPI0025E2B15D|nr:carboxypeptidase-like regulatory domain-containing protein [uncultured Mucilaginibacter sp.]
MKYLLLVALCSFFFVKTTFAQEELSGRVYENKTNVFLQGVKVEDLKTHTMTMTGKDGSFTIKAAVGDVICFSVFSYKPDTVYVANLKYMQVFLDLRQNMLDEVKVTNQEIKGNAGFAPQVERGPLNSQSVTYQTDANGDYKGGVKLRVFDGGPTQKQREKAVSDKEKQKQGILKVFNADYLKKYLPITGQEMQNFIILYMPDPGTFYGETFNLVAYLNGCYEEFQKIPLDDRQSKEYTQLKSSN